MSWALTWSPVSMDNIDRVHIKFGSANQRYCALPHHSANFSRDCLAEDAEATLKNLRARPGLTRGLTRVFLVCGYVLGYELVVMCIQGREPGQHKHSTKPIWFSQQVLLRAPTPFLNFFLRTVWQRTPKLR